MLITELTIKETNLNNILRALMVNENPEAINKPCKDILIKDILEEQPEVLVNCYTLKELEDSITFLHKKDFALKKAREIIPNPFNMGVVGDLNINLENLKSTRLVKRYRYYFMFDSKDETEKSICITYNPECTNKKQINVKLDSSIIKCSTLQVLFEKLEGRDIEPIKRVDTEQGKYSYYDLNQIITQQ